MAHAAADVERFARRVMREFSPPYPETITNDVFVKIEHDLDLRQIYDALCYDLKQGVVNKEIGKFIKLKTGLQEKGPGAPNGTTLITSYTKLG